MADDIKTKHDTKLAPGTAPSGLTAKKPQRDPGSDIDAFVQRTRAMQAANRTQAQRGRLIFALDATGSRQAAWDMATHVTVEMFEEVSNLLDVQLVYYRGFGEFVASGWISSPDRMINLMTEITCRSGTTQIGKVLASARDEAKAKPDCKPTLVFIGDAMEGDNIDALAATAAELGQLGVKAFMFHEPHQDDNDGKVESAFREIAGLTGGAYCRFDANAPHQLAQLLRAVAAFTVGGIKALEAKPGAIKLLEQLS
jgi:hypothetical protein